LKKNHLLIVSGYLLLLAIFAFPLIFKLDSQVYASGDEFFTRVWRYWWFKETLLDWWQSPGRTLGEFLWYGIINQEQYMNTGNTIDLTVFTYPLNLLFSYPLYWNLNLLLILSLNALGGFWLVNYLTQNRMIAFLGGLFMAFNPYVYYALASGRFKDGLFFFICLFLLFFLKMLEEKSWINPILTGLFFGVTAIFYWFYGINLSIFLILALICLLIWKNPGLPDKIFLKTVLICLVGLLIAYPFAIEYQRSWQKGELNNTELAYLKNFPSWETVQASNDRQGLTIHGAKAIVEDSLPLMHYPFIWILAPFFLLELLSRKKLKNWLFIISCWFFWLICLGPFIKIGSPPISNPIYQFLYKYYPLFSRQTHTSKFFSLCLIFFVLASMLGIQKLLQWLPAKKNIAVFLAILLISGYCYELTSRKILPLSTIPAQIPQFYRELATQQYQAVIEVPTQCGHDLYNYYQAFHGQRIYPSSIGNCYAKYAPHCPIKWAWMAENLDSKYQDNTFVAYLNQLTTNTPKAGFGQSDLQLLRLDGFKYLVLHEYTFLLMQLDGKRFKQTRLILEKALGHPIAQRTEILKVNEKLKDCRIVIYRL